MDELLRHTPEAELEEEQDTILEQGSRSAAVDKYKFGIMNLIRPEL